MMRVIIVRHGDTFAPGEAPLRIGARTDLPLVDSGKAQAHLLATHFAGTIFDHCLVSPLRRTRETAAIIAPAITAEPVNWLCEIDHGPDEGQCESLVLARIGRDALMRWEQEAIPPPGWTVDAAARIAGWRTFFAEARGTILLVTSNGAARYARLALGLPPARLRTGAYAEIVDVKVTLWDVRP